MPPGPPRPPESDLRSFIEVIRELEDGLRSLCSIHDSELADLRDEVRLSENLLQLSETDEKPATSDQKQISAEDQADDDFTALTSSQSSDPVANFAEGEVSGRKKSKIRGIPVFKAPSAEKPQAWTIEVAEVQPEDDALAAFTGEPGVKEDSETGSPRLPQSKDAKTQSMPRGSGCGRVPSSSGSELMARSGSENVNRSASDSFVAGGKGAFKAPEIPTVRSSITSCLSKGVDKEKKDKKQVLLFEAPVEDDEEKIHFQTEDTSDSESSSEASRDLETVSVAPQVSKGHHGKVHLKLMPNFISFSCEEDVDDRVSTRMGLAHVLKAQCKTDSRASCFSRLIAHPSSRGRLFWDLIGMIFLAIDLVLIPLQAFQDHIDFEGPAMVSLQSVSSVYWVSDLFASFFVGFHSEAAVEMRPMRIAIHYLRTWFLVDLTLLFLDWSFILLRVSQNVSFMRIGKTFSRGMRVLRLLRIVKMHGIITGLMERIRSEHVRTTLVILGQVMVIVLVNHFCACGWYALSHISAFDDRNWRLRAFPPQDQDDFAYRYATSLHWSLTQFTPASCEVTPTNKIERFYSVFVLLFALVTFSSFVSSITQAMSHLRKINSQKLAQENILRKYLTEHGITSKLVGRVWHYLHQQEVMQASQQRTKENDVQALQVLPLSMRVELRVESFAPELKRHPFFFHYGFIDPMAVRLICHKAVTEQSLLTKQELFSDQYSEQVQMFFCIQGCLEYALPCACAQIVFDASDDEDEEELPEMDMESMESVASAGGGRVSVAGVAKIVQNGDHINAGQWACEAALWSENVALCSPFVAIVKCEVLVIDTMAFRDLVERSEFSRKRVALYALAFAEHMPQMCNCYWRMAISNDFSILEDLVHRAFDFRGEVRGGSRVLRRTGRKMSDDVHDDMMPPKRRGSLLGRMSTKLGQAMGILEATQEFRGSSVLPDINADTGEDRFSSASGSSVGSEKFNRSNGSGHESDPKEVS